MKRIRLLLLLCIMGVFLAGCKSKEAKVQEQLDLGSKYMAELDYESAIVPSLTVLKYKIPFKPRVLAALEGIYISF